MQVPQRASEIKKFRWAVGLGLVVCGLLIVLWTYFVMLAVPQTAATGPSLEDAADHGCISTVRIFLSFLSLSLPFDLSVCGH